MTSVEPGTRLLPGGLSSVEALRLFSDYLKVTGVAHTTPEPSGDPRLLGKRLGLLNGSSWITLWANFFGKLYLPGVHLVNAGSEAVQVSFMEAHQRGEGLPFANILAFRRYARDLVELGRVDAILITCSTMSRAYAAVQSEVRDLRVPVLQIDLPMLKRAVEYTGPVLVVATHGPTVKSTHALLQEQAACLGKTVEVGGLLVEDAWQALACADVERHNEILARAICSELSKREYACVVLAQLSMAIFLLSHPDPVAEFGVPVLTSARYGFEAVRDHWLSMEE